MCASHKAELLVIDKHLFKSILEENMLKSFKERNALQINRMELRSLTVESILGRGTFGVVKKVLHKKTKTSYALKCVSRSLVESENQQENLLLEREILLENNDPFIVRALCTFKDKNFIYFLTEHIAGGELYDAIRKIGVLTKLQAQFYGASLVLALQSLHQRNIVYRDLKPETYSSPVAATSN